MAAPIMNATATTIRWRLVDFADVTGADERARRRAIRSCFLRSLRVATRIHLISPGKAEDKPVATIPSIFASPGVSSSHPSFRLLTEAIIFTFALE